MNSYERLQAMVKGQEVDRPGASLWKHFFLEDRNVEDLVKAHIAFEEQNQWDWIKVMANAIYVQEQYGAEVIWSKHSNDFPNITRRVVNSPRDYRHLKMVDVKTGAIAREVEVVKRLMDRYGGKVPVAATVFTPTSYAQELMCGNFVPWPFFEVVKHYPDDLKEGLKVLTEVTAKIIEEYVKAGVDGIFYANQHMYARGFTRETFEEFCKPYDLEAFKPAEGKTWFNVLHIHGTQDLFIDMIKDYPQQAINWEDINSGISISKMHEMYPDKILMAGIERNLEFTEPDREKLQNNLVKRVKNAAASAPSNKLIIATGCSQPSDIPDFRFNTFKTAMDTVFGKDPE